MTGTYVHQGFWINWRDGRLLGATLTTTNTTAELLNNFSTIFVTQAGASLWTLINYVIHEARASSQARKSVIIAYTAAGIFVTRLSRKVPEVLIRNPNCGYVQQYATNPNPKSGPSLKDELENRTAYGTYLNYLYRVATNYVQSCDTSNTSNSQALECESKAYPKSTLRKQTNATIEGTCPFTDDTYDDICLTDHVFQVNTTLLDTQSDLGINTPLQDRLLLRKVLTCAPIKIDPFQLTNGWNQTWNSTMNYNVGSLVVEVTDPSKDKLLALSAPMANWYTQSYALE
ncbi:MAG: hypothetical protein Q9160_001515 [Pyrenula sp. 1 TL-2023]